jgi:type VI secretion system protein VasI
MKYFTLLAFFIAPVLFADGDLKRDIAKIAAMQNSVERLAAYDAFAAKLGLTPGSQERQEIQANWQITVDTSPVYDSQTVSAVLDADSPIGEGFRRQTPSLILRYKEGKTSAFVVFGLFLGSDQIDATVRFGKDAAESQSWYISTDGKAAFSPGDTASFMKRLSTVDSFLIRVTPFNESPVTVLFSPKGVEKVIDAIQKAAAKEKG